MGSSTSHAEQEEDAKAAGRGSGEEDPMMECEFVDESSTLADLPLIGEQRVLIGRDLVTQEELEKMEAPDKPKEVRKMSIADSVVHLLSQSKDVVVEEYDLVTAITIIALLSESHHVLVVAKGRDIGSTYEYFSGTRTEVEIMGRVANDRAKCTIVDTDLIDKVDITKFLVGILIIRSSWGIEGLKSVVTSVRKQRRMLLVVYRLYPDHGYGNELFTNSDGTAMNMLIGSKPRDTECCTDVKKLSDLEGKEFVCLEDILHCLKTLAAREGFDIVRKDSLKDSRRLRFFCSGVSERSNKGEKPEKCPFHVYVKFDRLMELFRVMKVQNEHNHPMNPAITKWRLLNTKQIRIILSFRRSGMPLVEINRNIMEIFGLDIELTGRQLRRIKRIGLSNVDQLETDELARSIRERGGIVRIKEDPDEEGKLRRSAILVLDASEARNLRGIFGNPIFIDGTAVPNRLKWELTMITLVDQYLGIQPGGAMFSMYTNAETYDWFLNQLLEIIGNREKITLITDEDLAMSASIQTHNKNGVSFEICHVICAWHKERNFEKKMGKCGFTDDEKTAIRSLWKRICYSPSRTVVSNCIQQLRGYENQKLGHYIDKHIVPVLPNFARAYIPEFTAGYNVSSLSESANALLKRNLTAAYYTLTEIKNCVRSVFRQKNITAHEKLLLSRRGGLFLEKEFGVSVAPKVEELLIASLVKSFRLENIGNNTYRDKRYPDEVFHVEYPECECKKLQYSGLPCSHIMKWSLENKKNPMLLVSERYLAHKPSFTELCDYLDETGDIWREQIYADYRQTRKRIAEAFEEAESMLPDHVPSASKIVTPSTHSSDRTHVVRYNEILSYAKDLARNASINEDQTEKAIEGLKQLLSDISCGQKEPSHEVYEAVGKRRGRPSIARINAAFERARTRKCKICQLLGKDSSHLTGMCKSYKRVQEIGKEFDTAVTDENTKRCSICQCRGHNAKKCRAVLELQRELNDE